MVLIAMLFLFFLTGMISVIIAVHFSAEHQNGDDQYCTRIPDDPPQMGENGGVIAVEGGPGGINGVGKRQQVGDRFEGASHQVQIEPGAAEPCA